ncbi:DUF72 domain-containing protein [Thermanaeromonas sp. C210]|uniref:DUF72 domain-containing protein n=1 Tax=Thermanaeromonas sp. C210 TaxID=2731925 RepID=UPI00155CDDA8|nr:DUF72 domain-containing protein [Thermanaeromonas sp. C210]GFN22017.1 hypothetical protein TAMC210_03330 [Thermanaeromonas sp. C210]
MQNERSLGKDAKIYIGTSGYSYRDWIGPFYPAGTRQDQMLSFYAEEFSFAEVNSTFYHLPSARMFEGMLKKVPEHFLFTVKAFQGLTHRRGDAVREEAVRMVEALKPLSAGGRLGALVLQFPYSFKANRENREYLQSLREWLTGLPVVVEFRHKSWLGRDTSSLLHALGMGFVCVDTPGLNGLPGGAVQATASVGYVRFHGRNTATWWRHEEAWERYNYLYTEEELSEWVPRIAFLAGKCERVFVAFNNHFGAQAVVNARMLKRILPPGFSP